MAEGQPPWLSTNLDIKEESLFKVLDSSQTAMRLAKAYIRCKNEELQVIGSKFDADDYLQMYNERKSPFLSEPCELSVISTVCDITIDEMINKDVKFGYEVTAFLLTISCFAPGNIPLAMISKLAESRQMLERIIQTLDNYSIVEWNKDAGVIYIDDLIQKTNNRENCAICHALVAVQDTDSTTIQHALEVWNRAAECERWPKGLPGIVCHIVRLYMDLGNSEAAQSFGWEALSVVGKALTPDHPGFLQLRVINNSIHRERESMILFLMSQRRCRLNEITAHSVRARNRSAAEVAFDARSVLKFLKGVHEQSWANLGPRHRETLLTACHIAQLEYRLDRNKCDECYKVLVGEVEALGDGTEDDSEIIADIRRCLVQILAQRGELDEALTRIRAFYEAYKRLPEPKDDVIEKFLKDIGEILLLRRELREALAVFIEIHQLQIEKLGIDHFRARMTLDRMRDIENTLDILNGGQFMRELFLLETIGESMRLSQGSQEETLLSVIKYSQLPASSSMNLIVHFVRAEIYARENDKTLELILNEECVKSMEQTQVNDFQVHYEIALRLLKDRKYEASYQAFVSSLIRERGSSASDDVPKLKAQFDLAKTLRIEEPEESLRLFEEVFEKQKEMLGPDDLVTLNTQHEVACVLLKLNRHKDAIELFRQVYKKRKLRLGPGHSDTLTANYNVARLLVEQEDYQEALDILRLVFDEKILMFCVDDPDVLKTQHYIAYCLSRQGSYLDSFLLFKKVYLTRQRVLGLDHPDTLETQEELELSASRLKQDPKSPRDINQALRKHEYSKTEDLRAKLKKGNVEAVSDILRESVDIAKAVTSEGWTLLHTATLKGNVRMVEMVVAHAKQQLEGKNFYNFVNARTGYSQEKNSALHLAAESGHVKVAQFLLQHGVIYELKNEQGEKPVDVAANKKISRLLRLIDELFERTKLGNVGVLDVVDGLSVDKIRAAFSARNASSQTLTHVARSNKHLDLAGELMECYEEKMTAMFHV